MKLHLPLFLRKSLLSCIALVAGCTLSSGTLAFADDLVLGAGDKLSIDYAAAEAIPDLENGILQLAGDTLLQLLNCGSGDGKTYTLATGISGLLDAEGNPISLDSSNNAISNYFDTTQPGTGFWAGGTLHLTNAGTLQLVLHDETVKAAQTITARQTNPSAYQYYAGIAFEDISYVSDSSARGGAISGSVTMTGNGDVSFSGNTASGSDYACGGAIDGDVTMAGNGSVTFSGNTASGSIFACGGAIYGDTITLSVNGSVVFEGNTSSGAGGAIDGYTITLSNNESVTFSGNTASASSATYSGYGGAIDGSTIMLNNNGSVTFSGNTAESEFASSFAKGGAISGNTITLSNNGSVSFIGNTASGSGYACGGAISGYADITLSNNGSVTFSGNAASSTTSSADGGAIRGSVTMDGNGDVTFSGNKVSSSSSSASGGAIYGGTITLSNNESVTFSGNTASASFATYLASGGAISGFVTMEGNGDVTFIGNTASSSSAKGGAISGPTITLSNNRSVTFIGNTASSTSSSADGGAIQGPTITLSNNGSVSFIGNTASGRYAYGGAIEGPAITLSNNGSVTFIGNTASSSSSSAMGGAIYTYGNLSIRNNDSVEFYQNAQVANGTYRLRSIYTVGGSGAVISLSAAAGKCITFRDSIYIGNYYSNSSFKLNEAYEGKAQLGDIIFTGATTVDDLYTVKDNVAGTEEEIRLSRTTEVNALTELYGGRLRVEEGAIYQGQGITAMEGSAATVRVQNATLSHSGYDLTFNAGTTLELAGANSISGNLNLLDGSTLHIDFAGNEFTTNLDGSPLALTGDAFLRLTGAGNGDGKTYTLLTGVSGLLDAQGNAITLDDTNNAISNYFDTTQPGTGFWADGTLHLTNAGTLQLVLHNEAVKEAITVTTRQKNPAAYQYYAGVRFENIEYVSDSSPAYGGAIYGTYDSTITLSDNGSVTFSGNTASGSSRALGGAIDGSTITLSDNGSVTFIGNTAKSTSDSGYNDASGGAIYGGTITLSSNGSVTFSGNTASGRYAYGGAIYGDSSSTITLSNNGSLTFSGNTASSSDYSACGGAIYGSTITLSNNGSVTFSGNAVTSNSSSANGGAIYASGNLSIRNNESVLFEKNVEKSGSSYRLRSIYAGGSGDAISLSAAVGKSIEFRDSVYIASGSTVNLNADYTDADGETHKQQGDIIFTGKYAETHLNEILAADEQGRIATAEEIRLSRTTEVLSMTNLYGGRLRVEDGAVYQGQGITAMEGSAATVRVQNAELSQVGYDLIFNAGTALEVAGNSTIRGNVNLKEGSLFKLEKAASLSLYETLEADAATLTVNGGALLEGGATLNASLTLADGATLDMDALDVGAVTLNGALTFGGQVIMGDKLLGILSEMSGWEESVTLFTGLTDLVLPAVAADDAADRLWVGDVFSNLAGNENYYFNYVPEVGSLAVVYVPEPTTTTLGLLALSALAARRRRK